MTQKFIALQKSLDRYIRKFYLFELLKGLILLTGLMLSVFLIISVLQYFFYFSVALKTVIFYGFVLTFAVAFIDFVFFPVLRLLKLLKPISYEEASVYISKHFPEIKDKLINILELAKQTDNPALIRASINQKIDEIKIFDFSKAVDFADLLRYAKYFVFPLLLFLYLVFFNSDVLKKGTERFLAYNVYYKPEAPFKFEVLNKNLAVKRGSDFELKIRVSGKYIPSEVFIVYSGNRFSLIPDKKDKQVFTYRFESLNQSFSFYLSADGYKSETYTLKVLPSPLILDFKIKIIPPKYTGIPERTLSNTGDLVVPFGSKILWSFKTSDIDSLFLILDSVKIAAKKVENRFVVEKMLKKSAVYKVLGSNEFFKNLLLLKYNAVVIPDLPPDIKVFTLPDTSSITNFYFKGIIGDDYGFTSLTFNYGVFDEDEKLDFRKFKSVKIPFVPSLTQQEFYYSFDFQEFAKQKGKVVKYFFQVADNDYISGYKKTRTQIFEFRIPSPAELDSLIDSLSGNVEDKLQTVYNLANKIQRDIEQYQEQSLNENIPDWQKQDLLNQILDEHMQMQQLIEELKQENKKKLENLTTFSPEEQQEILRKQQELQKLMDELFTDEMKKLLEELQKLQEKFNSIEFDRVMKKMKLSYEDLSKHLDRNLELLKRMDVQQNLSDISERMEDLAKQQDSLSKALDEMKGGKIPSDLQEKQMEIEMEFKQLQQEYEETLQKNEELEKPMNLQDFEEDFQQVEQDLEQTKQNMFDNKKKKTQKSMQKTSEEMQKLAQKMQSQMQMLMSGQNAEDLQTLKFLLSAVLEFSFRQEDLYNQFADVKTLSKDYNSLISKQLELKDNFRVINDSIMALAKRNPVVKDILLKEVFGINHNLDLALSFFEKPNKPNGRAAQRKIIVSANNIALMLEESIQNLQNQMNSMQGNGTPKDNGKGMPSLSNLKQLQQSLQKQLEQMIQQLQQGQGNPLNSREMAEQIAKREMFDKMLRDLMNNSSLSPEQSKILNEIKKANDDIKSDIINNRLSTETLMRQRQIMVRLLEAEKAEMKQKYDNKRIAEQPEENYNRNPAEIEKMFKNYKSSNEVLQYNNLKLRQFYKNFHNIYINRLSQNLSK